jgi:hypothetical protein
MIQVELRLLQIVLSHVSGDKRTLALLHWDGATLRVAESLGPIGVVDPVHRDAVRVTAEAWVRRARRTAQSLHADPQARDGGLADVFPVRKGLGAALLWTPVTTLETPDAAAHFDALVRELRLDRNEPSPAECCQVEHRACSPSSDRFPAVPPGAPELAASCSRS